MPKILILTSCSKKKLKITAPAKVLYQGQTFRCIKKICNYQGIDYLILSAKYGLLTPNQTISYYDTQIKTKSDILRLRKKVIPTLREKIAFYDIILVIMGRTYRKVIQPLVDDRFFFLYHKRGFMHYNKVLSYLSRKNIHRNFDTISNLFVKAPNSKLF